MPVATRDEADRELVDLLTADPDWVSRQFDAIVAAEFPPGSPPSPGPPASPAARGPAPVTGASPAGRGFRPTSRPAAATRRYRQRSPPGRSRPLPAAVRRGG